MFSKLKNKILKKEEEETPLERAKKDIEEHYKPISPEDTFKDLHYYVSDGIAPKGLVEMYEIGRIVNEPRFINFTAKIGHPQGYFRYLILSNHMIPSSDPEFKDLDVYINKPNSKFKVIDYFRFQGIDQVALLHLPDEGWERFSKKKIYDDLMIKVRDFLLECLKMDAVQELDCDEWKERDLLAVGISLEGDYFELDALNNYGFSENSPDSISDDEEIHYAFKRLWELVELPFNSFSIWNLLQRYDMDYDKEGKIIENKLWTDIKNGLPLARVDERFVEYFKEEYRKKHPNRKTNFNEVELFVQRDNESKRRLDEILATSKLFFKFTYNRKGFTDEYLNLLSSKHLSYTDTFIFQYFLYEKIQNEEIKSENFNDDVEKACDEYYDKFIYNRNNYPKTLEKAIAFLIRDLSEDEINEIKDMEKWRFTASYHFFLGMYIRNQYGINNRQNRELLSECEDNGEGIIPFMADSYSGFILGELWEEINRNYSKIISSKNTPGSFYYNKVEEGKVPAPPWFRYPYSKLSNFLLEDFENEMESCKENGINVPSFLITEVDDKKPAQYLKLKEEVKVIAEHTMGCLPFTYNGEPKYYISSLKDEFRHFWLYDNEDFCPYINDTGLKCNEDSLFIYDGKTFFSIYNFLDFNRSYLFSEIDDAQKEIRDKNRFRFFKAKMGDEKDSEEIKDIYNLEDGLLIVFGNSEEEKERKKERLWNEIVGKYSKEEIWEKIKYSVALNGIYVKAMQNKDFRRELLNTRENFLLNRNINDTSWGLYKEGKKLIGNNLYGLALMEVRDEMRRLYENEDLIDWNYYKIDYNKDYDLSYVE